MSEKKTVDVIVYIPVGPPRPKQLTHHVIDTIQSVKHYITPNHQIVILDDSKGANLGEELQETFPDIDIVKSDNPYGGMAGEFYIMYARAWQYIHDNYNFKVMLDMDCDALITGPNPEDDAIAYFEKHPKVGNLGLFKVTSTGESNDLGWPARRIRIETSYLGKIFNREFHAHMVDLFQRAKANGFQPGYHAISAAHFIRPELLAKMSEMGLLAEQGMLRFSRLKDDHLIGLMVYVAGFEIAEFATPDDIMAIAWQGLPMPPEELAHRGKKVIHSTRYWENVDEDTIREFFRKRREEQQPVSS